MQNWKTSLAGVVLGLVTIFGPRVSAPGQNQAPPITLDNVLKGAAAIYLGLAAKDASNTAK